MADGRGARAVQEVFSGKYKTGTKTLRKGEMITYSVRDWGKHFENNRTRELKKLDWVPVPNKQDGDGYTAIMEGPDGAAIYGAFLACVQVASKCDPRGTLLRDGGKAHDAASLSRITRVPVAIMTKALAVLTDPDINWLSISIIADGEENPAPKCDIPAPECLEGKGRGGKGNEVERESGGTSVCIPPKTRKELDAIAQMRGISPECVEWFWNTNDARDWRDATGQIIRKPEQLLQNAWVSWQKSPPQTSGNGHLPRPDGKTAQPSVYSLQKALDAKRAMADEIFNQHATQGPLSTDWSSEAKRLEYVQIKKDIKELNARIAKAV